MQEPDRHLVRKLQCDEDGPVYHLRRWYEQFYVDVEDVTPEMTARFEYEIDTERANEVWHQEVEENLAAGRHFVRDPRAVVADQ